MWRQLFARQRAVVFNCTHLLCMQINAHKCMHSNLRERERESKHFIFALISSHFKSWCYTLMWDDDSKIQLFFSYAFVPLSHFSINITHTHTSISLAYFLFSFERRELHSWDHPTSNQRTMVSRVKMCSQIVLDRIDIELK